MAYQLWDTASNNLVGGYATEAEALEVVAGLVRRYRSRKGKRIEWLSLSRTDGGVIAAGPALAARALGTTTEPEPRPARRKRRAA